MTGLLASFPPVGPEWTFLVVTVLIVVGPLVAQRLRLPGLAGLIVGGMIVGPHVLGWLDRVGAVADIGQLGLLYLMFLAGVELDLDNFARNRSNALRFGALTFTLPLVAGTAVGLGPVGYGFAAALLYGSLWASHTLVAYPIAREHGLGADRATSTAVSGTVITDTLALFLLAVVVGFHTGSGGPFTIVKLLAGLAVLLLVSLLGLPWLARRFFRSVGQERLLRFVGVLVALNACALLAHEVGLESIVGAFFAGLGMNRLIPNRGALMERLEFLGSALLVPFFLISTGMLIDPHGFTSAHTLELAGLSLLVVVVGKLGAAAITGRLGGFSRDEVGLVFSLSVAQAAATIAAVIIGLEVGIFGEDLVNASLLVVLVSLVIATVGAARFAPRIEPPVAEGERLAGAVIVPAADEESTWYAALAGRLASVDGGIVIPVGVALDGDAESARRLVAACRTAAEQGGVEVEPVVRIDTDLETGVLRAGVEHGATLVVGSLERALRTRAGTVHGRGDATVAAAGVPILLLRRGREEPEAVLLALGDGAPAERALAARAARLLAEALDLPLGVLVPEHRPERPLLIEPAGAPLEVYRGPRVEALRGKAKPTDLVVVGARLGAPGVVGEASALLELPSTVAIAVLARGAPPGARTPGTAVAAAV